jgi:hypothetical protein
MRQLPTAVRQLAAIVLLGGLLASIGALIVNPLVTYLADVQERMANERVLLARFNARAAQEREALELERRRAEMNADGEFLEGDSVAIQLANLQSLLATIAAANSIRVRSARTLPVRERGELRLAGVRVEFHAELGPLRKTLHDIEAKRPFLFIEAVQISHLSGGEGAEPGAMLDARLDVFGAVLRTREW